MEKEAKSESITKQEVSDCATSSQSMSPKGMKQKQYHTHLPINNKML